jgi:hypothetical protein
MEGPQLIENNAKSYLSYSLNNCRENRIQLYYIIFNTIVLTIFIFIFGIGLYYCHGKQITPYEKYKKQLKDQDYIMTKIRENQIVSAQNDNITKLPINDKKYY